MNQWMENKICVWKKKEDGREARVCRNWSRGWAFERAGFELRTYSPCAQRRGIEVPSPGPRARQQGACKRRRLCSWKETRRPAASASKPDTTSASARGYTNTPASRMGQMRYQPPPPCYLPSPAPGLTIHRLGLRVVVGEPSPQAETGSLGVGPDTRVSERQRGPAGGAVQAWHGAHPA